MADNQEIEMAEFLPEKGQTPKKENFFKKIFKFNKKDKSKTELSRDISQHIESNTNPDRLKWDSYSEYLLSIIGFVIDLGNVWR